MISNLGTVGGIVMDKPHITRALWIEDVTKDDILSLITKATLPDGLEPRGDAK